MQHVRVVSQDKLNQTLINMTNHELNLNLLHETSNFVHLSDFMQMFGFLKLYQDEVQMCCVCVFMDLLTFVTV